MSSNKGITLVVLVTIIIIVLILSGTATYVGYNTIQNSAEQRFLYQLQEINEAVNMHSEDYESLGLITEEHTENSNIYNYVLSTEEDYNKIGLYNIKGTVYVNFKEGLIYSKDGINGKHTLKDFGIEYYKTEHEEHINNEISFDVTLEPQEYSWKYVVYSENIKCNGNPLDGNVLYAEYREDANYEWKRVNKTANSFELELKEPGIYELKYRDVEGKESDIKEIYAYVKDGLQLYLDGEYNENYKHNESITTWKDLSGNGNDATLNGGTWNSNFLEFDGADDYILVNELQDEETSQKTIELIDVNGKLYENNNIGMIYEFSENWNNNNTAFGVSINEYGTMQIALTIKGNQGYNIKGTNINFVNDNKTSKYSYIVNSNKTNNEYINIYKNSINQELSVMNYAEDISNMKFKNYKLYIASRAGNSYFAKINLGSYKVYNRALTEKEIEQNYNIDKIRYNISE